MTKLLITILKGQGLVDEMKVVEYVHIPQHDGDFLLNDFFIANIDDGNTGLCTII